MTQLMAPDFMGFLDHYTVDASLAEYSHAVLRPGQSLPGKTGEIACCYMVWRGALDLAVTPPHANTEIRQRLNRFDAFCTTGLVRYQFCADPEPGGAPIDCSPIDWSPIDWSPMSERLAIGADTYVLCITLPLRAVPFCRFCPTAQVLRADHPSQDQKTMRLGFQGILVAFEARGDLLWRQRSLGLLTDLTCVSAARAVLTALGSSRNPDDLLYRVVFMAMQRRDQAWTLEEMAREAGMSRTSFSTRFKILFNSSPGVTIKNFRLQLAASLLRQGHQSVKAVADYCGYKSISVFIRAFTREFGGPPGRWMRDQAVPMPPLSRIEAERQVRPPAAPSRRFGPAPLAYVA